MKRLGFDLRETASFQAHVAVFSCRLKASNFGNEGTDDAQDSVLWAKQSPCDAHAVGGRG